MYFQRRLNKCYLVQSTQRLSFQDQSQKYSLTISFDNEETITVDCLIWAVGRAANTSGFGIEKTGVKLTERGNIYSDEFENTSVPGIYALGETRFIDLDILCTIFSNCQSDFSIIKLMLSLITQM